MVKNIKITVSSDRFISLARMGRRWELVLHGREGKKILWERRIVFHLSTSRKKNSRTNRN
jgi:hypothetical protein